jgi:HD-GYP domain-containing protein (c-di-GMP phosphodiesterase class II)
MGISVSTAKIIVPSPEIRALFTDGRDTKSLRLMNKTIRGALNTLSDRPRFAKHLPEIEGNIKDKIWVGHPSTEKRMEHLDEIIGMMYRFCGELKWEHWEIDAYSRSIIVLLDLAERSCYTTYPHCGRTAKHAEILIPELMASAEFNSYAKLGDRDVWLAYLGALLHDIGKAAIPFRILRLKKRLLGDNLMKMQQHPKKGMHTIAAIRTNTETILESRHPLLGMAVMNAIRTNAHNARRSDIDEVLKVIHYHHRRYDGLGYPKDDKIRGEDIPVLARLISILDAFEAGTSWRIYEPIPRSIDVMIDSLKRGAGKEYDEKLVGEICAALANAGIRKKIDGVIEEGRLLVP